MAPTDSCRPSRSTHYPSWGLETFRVHDVRTRTNDLSLPLMGIGNRGQRTPPPPSVPGSHYPSWGLETRLAARSCCQGQCSHYPSWGLETDFLSVERLHTGHLITPHGDWKPVRNSAGTGYELGLITPHGDWKPHFCAWRRTGPCCSLPLMGIGNSVPPSTLPHSRHLITPHGDWKPVLASRFQTAAVLLITPHGDWKPAAGGVLSAPVPPLITPHGDWKPLLFSRFHVLMMSGASQNKHPWATNLRLSAKPGMVLCSSAQVTRQRMDQFLPCHVSSS